MKDEFEKDNSWDLLGCARKITVLPDFSARVLLKVRQSPVQSIFSPLLLRGISLGVLTVLAVGFFLNLIPIDSPSLVENQEFNQTFERLADTYSFTVEEDIQFW